MEKINHRSFMIHTYEELIFEKKYSEWCKKKYIYISTI